MAKDNVARRILWPGSNVLLRIAFLYVGQGASALLFAGDGEKFKVLLVDINMGRKNGGIDVPRLVKDVLGEQSLTAFVNTHPHDDHVCGVDTLVGTVKVEEIWHSGHVPSKKYGECYATLKAAIEKVKKDGGSETVLEGSRSPKPWGEIEYYVLGPAEYLTDEVNEDQAEERYRRIHEQCAVLKFGNGENWIMIPGDADKAAFENHITKYHGDRLRSFALGASHHGSRTFFMMNEGEEPYLDALNTIDPGYIVISAPLREESDHDHPHEDAEKLYVDHAGQDNVVHTGAERMSYFFDVYRDGTHSGIQHDNGDLAATYGLESDDDDGGAKSKGPFVSPKSSTGDLTPRRYG